MRLVNSKNPTARSLHLATLFALAVAQPLFDLLSRYPEFLVAHRVGVLDLLLLTGLIGIVAPLLLIVTGLLGGIFSSRLAAGYQLSLVGLLLGIFAVQLLKRLALPGWWIVSLAGLSALFLAGLYSRSEGFRTFLTWLSPAAILFPILFLFFSPASNLLYGERITVGNVTVNSDANVVFIVFDEFPLLSLLDSEGKIDRGRFPNLSDLASRSYWFRNATTVSEVTQIAVPAMLDGLYPTPDQPSLPIVRDHPRNLFTLFSRSHHLEVTENITRLSPATVETDEEGASGLLWRDLSVVSGHVFLPIDLSTWLPPITESWKEFGTSAASEVDEAFPSSSENWSGRARDFRNFLAKIDSDKGPTLYFFHSLLPHSAWEYLPDGKRYGQKRRGAVRGVWGANRLGIEPNQWLEDPWITLQGQQSHLLQVGFVDTLVGELITTLQSRGLYENTLLVIAADHGAGFQPGDSRRELKESNYSEILRVPLLVKAPRQQEGRTIDENVELIDVLPIVADLMEIDLSWTLDGRSPLRPGPTRRTTKIAFNDQGDRFTFELAGNEHAPLLEKRIQRLGQHDWKSLFEAAPPGPDLIGRPLLELPVGPPSRRLRVQLLGDHFFERVDPDSSFIPAQLSGQVSGPVRADNALMFAVAVNGVVEAVSRTSPQLDDNRSFTALVSPDTLKPGSNEVEIFLIEGDLNGFRLRQATEGRTRYELVEKENRSTIVNSRGREFQVAKERIIGWVTAGATESEELVFLGGWAADATPPQLLEQVVVFLQNKSLAASPTDIARSEAVRRFDRPDLARSGFRFEFSRALLEGTEPEDIRLFGITSDGVAGELRYAGRPWFFSAVGAGELRPYRWGEWINPAAADHQLELVRGWGKPEATHVWTAEKEATLNLLLPPHGTVRCELRFSPYLAPGHPRQRVEVVSRGEVLATWKLDRPGSEDRSFTLPASRLDRPEVESITFRLPDAVSPSLLGLGRDQRHLGIALAAIRCLDD